MKILYIEDELTKNIDRLRRLFSYYLDEKIISELKRLENDEYGAKPQEIKNIIESTNIIDMEDRFPDAMRRIVHSSEQYDCYIVDRNLVENQYEFSEVAAIDQNYNETLHKKYQTREGDYLLNWLIINSKEPKSTLMKFHFLTAYNENDVRGKDIIEMYLDFGAFTGEQFFDKSNQSALDKLKYKIDHIVGLNIRYENRRYLDILRENLGEEDAELFLKVLLEKDDKTQIIENLTKIRIIYEHILEKFETIYPQYKDHKGMDIKKLFSELEKKGQINKMLRNYCYTIWQVCSDYGAHKDKRPLDKIFQPTLNTVNSIIFALKEIFLWFGNYCCQLKK